MRIGETCPNTGSREEDVIALQPIISFTGVYNADGGLPGELRYIVGHLLGTTSCALCDISHSPLRRKPAWDDMVARLPVPLEAVHRNELSGDLAAVARETVLPAVFAHRSDGSIAVALNAADLAALDGSVDRLELALRTQLT